jgi:HEAT repeat protein
LALGAATLLFLSQQPAPREASALGLHPPSAATTQSSDTLTTLQRQIETQRGRLSSADAEERRDAVVSLGALQRPEASRAAGAALGDRSAVVRAHATRAVLSLGPADVAALLAPVLLRDRDEFVRRESAYALGLARAGAAVPALVSALERDKQASVRGAAAVALGQIADPATVPVLARKLSERIPGTGLLSRVTRGKREEDEFVRRSAAVALGQIGDRAAAPALIDALSKERSEDDVRREAARALGLIGDPSAVPALRAALSARDPHLSRIAFEALRKLEASAARQP